MSSHRVIEIEMAEKESISSFDQELKSKLPLLALAEKVTMKLQHSAIDNFHKSWATSRLRASFFHEPDNIHATFYFAKDHVVVVEPVKLE